MERLGWLVLIDMDRLIPCTGFLKRVVCLGTLQVVGNWKGIISVLCCNLDLQGDLIFHPAGPNVIVAD